MSRSTLTLAAMAVLAIICLLATTALGASIQAAGAAALKTAGLWVNIFAAFGSLAGLAATVHLTDPEPKVQEKIVYRDKIVEKRVEVPVPATQNAAYELLADNCCQTDPLDPDDEARNALDTVTWRLLKRDQLGGVLDAVDKIKKALTAEVPNESQPSPAVAMQSPPAAVAGAQIPAAGVTA